MNNYNTVNELHPMITICGSTKLHKEILDAATEYTKNGWMVLYPACYNKENVVEDTELKEQLVDIHKQMILQSHAILVVAEYNHIGESVSEEIAFAKLHRKGIIYKFVNTCET